jgi:hypothetical protein
VPHLSDGVVGSPVGAEAVGTRLELRLKDWLEHQLEGRLHDPIPHGGDAQPACLAAGLGDHPFPCGQGEQLTGLQIGSQFGEEHLLAPVDHDGAGRLRVHSSRPSALVTPHPTPRHQQERRVIDEIEQIIEPTIRTIGRPPMQLGLHLQYPRRRLIEGRPRRADVHRRPPGLAVPALRFCCLPSPCGRLSRPRTTTEAPPRSDAIGWQRACPPPTWTAGGKGSLGTVPVFTINRSTSEAPSFSPAALATGTPQTFPAAPAPTPFASARAPSPSNHRLGPAAARPRSTRFEPVPAA